eukprot:3309649-Rhodomonas_salina.1
MAGADAALGADTGHGCETLDCDLHPGGEPSNLALCVQLLASQHARTARLPLSHQLLSQCVFLDGTSGNPQCVLTRSAEMAGDAMRCVCAMFQGSDPACECCQATHQNAIEGFRSQTAALRSQQD